MTKDAAMVDIIRGGFTESVHRGHAVICDQNGDVVAAWGDGDAVVLPRSSSKMLQALPLVESGAADAFGLTSEQLALSCASHQGAPMHTDRVSRWLGDLGLDDHALCCGPQMPRDAADAKPIICSDGTPMRMHNNCSGKHSGFLTLTRHIGGDGNYVAIDHPVQRAVRDAYEDMTGQTSPGYGIDGCSAPNFATTMTGMARAMARMANAGGKSGARDKAAARLVDAMIEHPHLVAGDGRACTEIMRAAKGRVAVKTGAEGFFIAILPDLGLGVALKISDGATRASECAMAALLVHLGALDRDHPDVKKRLNPDIRNWDGLVTGSVQPAKGFAAG